MPTLCWLLVAIWLPWGSSPSPVAMGLDQ
jgi:hypothetical protein